MTKASQDRNRRKSQRKPPAAKPTAAWSGQVQLLRMRVATAENRWKAAKEQADQAKRRRKLAKLLAKRARKAAKEAKVALLDARAALARAEEAALFAGANPRLSERKSGRTKRATKPASVRASRRSAAAQQPRKLSRSRPKLSPLALLAQLEQSSIPGEVKMALGSVLAGDLTPNLAPEI